MDQKAVKPPIFGKSKPLWIFVVLAMAGFAYTRYVLAREDSTIPPSSLVTYSIVMAVVGAALTAGFALGLGWLAYWIGRRSGRAARVTAYLVAGFMLLGGFIEESRKRDLERQHRASENWAAAQLAVRDARRGTDLAAATQESADAMRSGDVERITAAIDRLKDALRRASADGSDESKAVVSIAQLRTRQLGEMSRELVDRLKELAALGGVAPASLVSKEAADARAAMAESARLHAGRYRDFLVTFEDTVRADMNAAGIGSEAIHNFFGGFNRGDPYLEKLLEWANLNVESFDAMSLLLTTLSTHWGQWQADQAGTFRFTDSVPAATIDAYNAASVRLRQQEAVDQRVLGELGSLLSTPLPPSDATK